MFLPTLISAFLSIVSLQGINTHQLDTKENPIDLSTLRHIRIHNYTGPIRASGFKFMKDLESVEITSCDIDPWHDDVMHVLKNIKRISIANTKVNREVSSLSSCCENFREFEMNNNDVNVIHFEIIGSWPLEKLVIIKQKIPVLKSNVITTKTLRHLTMAHCDTESMEDGCLLSCENLEHLNLEENKLKVINKKAFEPLKNLKVLNLERNLLEKLTTEQIPHLPNLEKISIAHNPIKELNLEGIEKVAPKLSQVDISGIEGIDTTKSWGVELIKSAVI